MNMRSKIHGKKQNASGCHLGRRLQMNTRRVQSRKRESHNKTSCTNTSGCHLGRRKRHLGRVKDGPTRPQTPPRAWPEGPTTAGASLTQAMTKATSGNAHTGKEATDVRNQCHEQARILLHAPRRERYPCQCPRKATTTAHAPQRDHRQSMSMPPWPEPR